MISKNTNDQPMKNWRVFWGGTQLDLYAINAGSQIIFTDSIVNIFFKDDQIYRAEGLLPNNSVIEVEIDDTALIYKIDGNEVSRDICEKREFIDISGSKKYYQVCTNKGTGEIYENFIRINSEGLVTELSFRVNPNYPALELGIM